MSQRPPSDITKLDEAAVAVDASAPIQEVPRNLNDTLFDNSFDEQMLAPSQDTLLPPTTTAEVTAPIPTGQPLSIPSDDPLLGDLGQTLFDSPDDEPIFAPNDKTLPPQKPPQQRAAAAKPPARPEPTARVNLPIPDEARRPSPDGNTMMTQGRAPAPQPPPRPAAPAPSDKTMMRSGAGAPITAPKAPTAPRAAPPSPSDNTMMRGGTGSLSNANTSVSQPPAFPPGKPAGSTKPDAATMMKSGSGVSEVASANTQLKGPSNGGTSQSDVREHTSPRIARPALPAVGEHIRHYELIRKLGEGGMGSVFLARDNKLGRRVAIKFLHTVKPELAERFIVEARTTAAVAHENIVIIYEADEHNGFPYMVLEYLQGQTLTAEIPRGKPMPYDRAVELMLPVVKALASAHELGIVHRDLKFDNVFVTESGQIKVLDFGIAKLLNAEPGDEKSGATKKLAAAAEAIRAGKSELTQAGALMGTVAYMSPEQWGLGSGVDHRTDIWAAGIMLYLMLSGRHPLKEVFETGTADLRPHLSADMPSLGKHAPSLPKGLVDAIDRCLRTDKAKRFADAKDLLRELEPFQRRDATHEINATESPYTGLAAFQETDAFRFFGRSKEVASALTRLRDQPIMAVVGPSGAGKSSFVRAGVVPALKRSGDDWESIVVRPGREPLEGLASVLSPVVSSSTTIVDDFEHQKKLVERMRSEPGFAGLALRRRAQQNNRKILIFVDQFEELFTQVSDLQTRLAFTNCLTSIADDATSPTRVVLSIRSDFLDRVHEDARFMEELSRGLFFLGSPDRDGLREALVAPAEMAGFRFENEEMVDDMLEHLKATQGALPLLQFTAAQLWEYRDTNNQLLTLSSYDAMGGIAGALASHADSVLNALSPAARGLAKSLFMRLVTPERTRAIVPIEDIYELAQDKSIMEDLLNQVVKARLLTVQTAGGGSTVELVHESLVTSWPTLKAWLEESGEDAVFLEQLRNATKQWQAKDMDPGLLWRGDMAEEAHRFDRRFAGDLPPLQRQFIDDVIAQEKKTQGRKRLFAVGGITVLVGIALASIIAVIIIQAKEQEAVAAQQEAVAQAHTAQQRLEEVERKEAQRAEAAKKAEESARAAERASIALQSKNKELIRTLRIARRARTKSAQSALAARKAREAALRSANELAKLLEQEKERAARLREQLGSSIVEVLK
ncbi:MAG: protein kinase [Myxococcota bacterium]